MTTPKIIPTIETPHEIVANCIATISRGIGDLRAGRLNDRALLVLIHDATGIPKRDIKAVIDSLESLEATYLKKRPS